MMSSSCGGHHGLRRSGELVNQLKIVVTLDPKLTGARIEEINYIILPGSIAIIFINNHHHWCLVRVLVIIIYHSIR